jgi:hypothetical protein
LKVDCIVADCLVHEAVELICSQQHDVQDKVPGRDGGGCRFARATISWPFATHCMTLYHESLPPLMSATHFIVRARTNTAQRR